MYYVYVIRCEDNSLYTGYTTDVRRRFEEHSDGKKGAKYTKSHKPTELCAVWKCENRSAAMSFESFFKTLKKDKKEEVIKNPEIIFDGTGEKFIEKIVYQKTKFDNLFSQCNTKKSD